MQHIALRYFLEVARTGSITEASAQLNVSGSAISRQISRLETELAVELFERRPRGMVLSPAGELLVKHVRRIALDTERALADVREMRGPQRGLVRVATYEGFAVDRLARIIADFRAQFPGVLFHVWVGNSSEICERVNEGNADIGITYSYSAPAGVKIERIVRRPMYALIPRSHPLSGRKQVTLADLSKEPMAMPDKGRTQRQLIDAALATKGLAMDPVFSTNSMATLKVFAFAAETIMFSSSAGSKDNTLPENIVAIPVVDETMKASVLQIVTMQGRNLPRSIAAFLDFLGQSVIER
ncbi:LysR family transcriptional regulator [Brucella anthropi]|uniref:LysR family transcriptional regulator n=1 Tax=Brucella anthropi TaxID=529 RepID=UPI00125CDE2F|nr:LysR family transcriptional regulator [Brucella anthropi]QFP64584.1 LysR family transcriptional regulator [Brucella anthropi]